MGLGLVIGFIFIYRGVLVSTPLQAISFSSYLLNVLLQLANKNGIQNNNNKKLLQTSDYK
jgi:hypothetical protein